MKDIWQVIKINNKWVIYNSETGQMLTKFVGKGTKKEAQEYRTMAAHGTSPSMVQNTMKQQKDLTQ